MKIVLVVLVLALVTSACSKSDALPADKRLKVVATAYPVFEAAASIGGRRVHATNLLPLNPFAPLTPKQRATLEGANLVLTLGKGVQPSVDEALKNYHGPVINVLDSFSTQMLPGTDTVDPYVWENPQNLILIEQQIRDQYNKMDPAGSKIYTKYAVNLAKDLKSLDLNFSKTIATCQRKNVVAEDNRFAYLTAHYGLTYTPIAADQFAGAVAAEHPFTVFEQTLPSLSDAKSVLATYNVRISVLDPVIAQTDQARRGGSNYSEVMNLDLWALRAGLGCAPKVSIGN